MMWKLVHSSISYFIIISSICVALSQCRVEERDFYEILGVSENSSQEEIKKAFRSMAKIYHPDKCKEPNAEEKFKEIATGLFIIFQKVFIY